jgi:hypothetical protein
LTDNSNNIGNIHNKSIHNNNNNNNNNTDDEDDDLSVNYDESGTLSTLSHKD